MKWQAMAALLVGLVFCGEALAAPTLFIYVDEWGNASGTDGQGFLGDDPTLGVSNWDVLIFNLPFKGTPGDLQVYEQRDGRKLADIIRFTGQGQMIFYSNDANGLDEPANTPTPPQNAWPVGAMNAAQVDMTGSGADGSAVYVPRAGQPGWNVSGPSYTILFGVQLPSVPEPATVVLMTLGGLAVLLRRRGRRSGPGRA
jgi:hypothetical protein